jgi:hypothetical protein
MTRQHWLRVTGAGGVAASVISIVLMTGPRSTHADDSDNDESRIQQGLEIAPVPLKLAGKDRALVGLGSYIVNAQADCNGCHRSNGPQYVPAGNPYLLPSPPGPYLGKKISDPATYLGGGRDFGAYSADPFPHIISRNLTPDKTGMPEGGHTFTEFVQIMRTDVDLDHVHPTCTGAPDGHCLPQPFDGSRLQIMAWPAYKDMTDYDLRAIYEYLSAIPCIAGPPAPDPLRNDCK